jgi:hypothetical protein
MMFDVMQETRDLMRPGNKVRLRYPQPDNPNNKLIWVLAVVDQDQIVYRHWWNGKQRWWYAVEDIYAFELTRRRGFLTPAGRFDPKADLADGDDSAV